MPNLKTAIATIYMVGVASLAAYSQPTSSANALPTELEAKTLIKEVQENYQAMQRYQFSVFETTINQSEAYGLSSKQQFEQRYELTIDGEDRFRIESANSSDKSLVISDGVTRWAYSFSRNQFIKQAATTPPANPQPGSPVYDPTVFAMRQRTLVSRLRQIGPRMTKIAVLGHEKLTMNGQAINCLVLHLTNGSSNDMKLWIDTTRKLVIRDWQHARSKSANGITMGDFTTQYDYTPLKINEPLSNELFTLTPPAEAIEVTEFKAPSPPAPNLTGKEAPLFATKDLRGNTVEMVSYKGQVVLLNFWASWCGPCVAEMPHIQKLHEAFKDKGLFVIGINNEELEIANEFMKNKSYTFASLIDEGRAIAKQYQIASIPQVVLIGRDGKVKWHSIGFGSGKETELRTAVEKVLNNETPAPSSSFPSMVVRP